MSYSTSASFKTTYARLAGASRREFERIVLSLVRIEWPDTVQAKELGGYDNAGIDLLVLGATRLAMAAQCKGFEVSEAELGDAQLNQCLKSIDKYDNSGLLAEVYLLIINRAIKGRIRTTLEERLARLVSEGRAGGAHLLDCHATVMRSFEAMRRIVSSRVGQASKERIVGPLEAETTSPVDIVPFEKASLVTNPYQLLEETTPATSFADPSKDILSDTRSRVVLLLGEAGSGKTTTTLRCLEGHVGHVLYVPAASIPPGAISNRAVFFEHCFDTDHLLEFGEGPDAEVHRHIGRTVAVSLLDQHDSSIALVIDGLDESAALTWAGGMHHLFNHLRNVRGRVILTCRSELWNERRRDFTTSFGIITSNKQVELRHVTLLRLLLWDDPRIAQLARKYRDLQTDPKARGRVDEFLGSVERSGYTARFGDIPRRPLFLRCILETLVMQDLAVRNRASLLRDWAIVKIVRDFSNPIQAGNPRVPIAPKCSSSDESVELSFIAMKAAARCMTTRVDGRLDLTADCSFGEIVRSHARLTDIDRTGLLHNSLLVPRPLPKTLSSELRVCFSHRAFQEFFLALSIFEDSSWLGTDTVLPSIASWLEEVTACVD